LTRRITSADFSLLQSKRQPMHPRIHYTKPSITELEVRYATDAAHNG